MIKYQLFIVQQFALDFTYLCMYVNAHVCMLQLLVVDGGWSKWRLGPCSKTCGGGIQNYTRVCDNPKPSYGGKGCEGPSSYTGGQLCNTQCCPGQMKCIVTRLHCTCIPTPIN